MSKNSARAGDARFWRRRAVRVLVTGANGFVGKAVIANLSRRSSFDVVARLRVASGNDLAGASLQLGDLGADGAALPRLDGFDAIIHCAARAHAMNEMDTDALAAYRQVNTQDTINLAEQAAPRGVKRLVFLSSIKVAVSPRNWIVLS